MISIGKLNQSNLPAKPCAFGPKRRNFFKNFKKSLRFFDQTLYGKLTFSQFLLNISWSSASSLMDIPLEDYTKFLQQFLIHEYITSCRN